MGHVAVLAAEATEWLRIQPEGAYIDCTLGAGGYTAPILERLTSGRVLAIDRDPAAIAAAKQRFASRLSGLELFQASFGELSRMAGGAGPIQGIVADLGLSRDQLEDASRGFSFQLDGPLDMRMDPTQDLTAGHIVNHYGEEPLANLIYRLAGEGRSRRIARAIVRARPLHTTIELTAVIERAAPRKGRERIHPATRTFQALRMAVNDELEELEKMLEQAPPLLAPGGRLVVVSFHSGEDRLVKNAMRAWSGRGVLRILTKHVVRPGEQERRANPAARSGRLRAAEKV